MEKKDKLFRIADQQLGYFTTRQAETAGFTRSNFYLKIQKGEWIKELRGIYRLARYPVIDRAELALWTLWSCDNKGIPQGVWSHETALDIHELSDLMPAKMHMTVLLNFRRRSEIPKCLHLHFANISKSDIEMRQGYKVTTPLRSLIDVIEEKTVSKEQIILALNQALQKGLILQKEVQQLPQFLEYKNECNF